MANDYPRASISRRASGEVQVLVTVADDGKPTNCRVVRSSQDADLDATTCAIFMKRVRYEPAVGTDGKPVDGPFYATLRWALPD